MKYRKISPCIWNDAKVRELSDKGKLALLFLLTHPHMTPLGAIRANAPGLACELGWSEKVFRKAFGEVLALGIAKEDAKAPLVWFPNFLRHNMPESPNVVRSWVGAFRDLPESPLKGAMLERTGEAVLTLGEGFRSAFAEAFPGVLGGAAPGVSASRPGSLAGAPPEALPIPFGEAFPEGMPNQEQEQEQRRKGGRGTRAGGAIRDGGAVAGPGAFPSGGRRAPGGAFACAGSVSPDGSPQDGAPADGRLPGEYPSGERPQGGGVAAGMPLPGGRLPCGARSASHPAQHPLPHQAPYPAGHPAGFRAGHPAPQRAERPFPSSGSFPGGPLLEGHPQREGFLSCWSAYPVQQGREDAWREWLRLWERRALPEPCAVREAIRLMLAEDTRWRRGKIPKMAKWLAGMGWNDRPFVEPEGCAGAGRPRVGTAARRAQDNDDMAKMLLQVRRAHAQSGLYASNAGQSGAALPAGGQDARAAAGSGGGLGGGSCGVSA